MALLSQLLIVGQCIPGYGQSIEGREELEVTVSCIDFEDLRLAAHPNDMLWAGVQRRGTDVDNLEPRKGKRIGNAPASENTPEVTSVEAKLNEVMEDELRLRSYQRAGVKDGNGLAVSVRLP